MQAPLTSVICVELLRPLHRCSSNRVHRTANLECSFVAKYPRWRATVLGRRRELQLSQFGRLVGSARERDRCSSIENEHHCFIYYSNHPFFFNTSSSLVYRKAWLSHSQYFYSLCSQMVQNMQPTCPNGYSSYTPVECVWLRCFYFCLQTLIVMHMNTK